MPYQPKQSSPPSANPPAPPKISLTAHGKQQRRKPYRGSPIQMMPTISITKHDVDPERIFALLEGKEPPDDGNDTGGMVSPDEQQQQ